MNYRPYFIPIALLCLLIMLGMASTFLFKQKTPNRDYQSIESGITSAKEEIKIVESNLDDTLAPNRLKSPRDLAIPDREYQVRGSLTGSSIKGQLAMDSNGDLIVDQNVRFVFEYFLSTLGEQSLESIREEIISLATLELSATAKTQLMALYDRFIAYEENKPQGIHSSGQFKFEHSDFQSIYDHLMELQESRREFLGEEVAVAFFEQEELRDRYYIGKKVIETNPAFSDYEKQQQLTELQRSLPRDYQEKLNRIEQFKQVEVEVNYAREQGADKDLIYHLRADVYGHKAALRIQDAEAASDNWRTRYDAYSNAKKVLSSDQSLTDRELSRAIENLRKTHFSDREIREVVRIDRIENS